MLALDAQVPVIAWECRPCTQKRLSLLQCPASSVKDAVAATPNAMMTIIFRITLGLKKSQPLRTIGGVVQLY